MVTLEEELFEAKTIQLDLLDKVEYLEPLEVTVASLEETIASLEERLAKVM